MIVFWPESGRSAGLGCNLGNCLSKSNMDTKVIAPNTDNSVEFDPMNGIRALEATLQVRD